VIEKALPLSGDLYSLMNVPTQPFRPAQPHGSLDSQEEAKEYLPLPPQPNHSTQIEYVTALKDLAIAEENSHPILPYLLQGISPK
jgi:hypothetical protein